METGLKEPLINLLFVTPKKIDFEKEFLAYLLN
jgi:hypothetical protein